MQPKMRYRLALDIGTTSIGWAMLRLNPEFSPIAIIRAGVRIFSDGRDAKDRECSQRFCKFSNSAGPTGSALFSPAPRNGRTGSF